MASTEEEDKVGKSAFSKWKYKHYFTIVERKGKNLYLKCTLCSGGKRLSTSAASNSNLMKHLTTSDVSVSINIMLMSNKLNYWSSYPPPMAKDICLRLIISLCCSTLWNWRVKHASKKPNSLTYYFVLVTQKLLFLVISYFYNRVIELLTQLLF